MHSPAVSAGRIVGNYPVPDHHYQRDMVVTLEKMEAGGIEPPS